MRDLEPHTALVAIVPSRRTGYGLAVEGDFVSYKNDYSIGIGEIEGGGLGVLRLSPNPATDELTIHADIEEFTSIVVLNALGQEVIRTDMKNGSTTLHVAALPRAAYIVRAFGPGGSTYGRFIKQ